MLAIAGVVFGVEAAYFTDIPRPVPAEQGRYVFTALVPLAMARLGAHWRSGGVLRRSYSRRS